MFVACLFVCRHLFLLATPLFVDILHTSCFYLLSAIMLVGGLDVLLNLLETEDLKCKIGALLILKDISISYSIKRAIAELDGITPLIHCLSVCVHTCFIHSYRALALSIYLLPFGSYSCFSHFLLT